MNDLVVQSQVTNIVESIRTLESELSELENMKKTIDLRVTTHKKAIEQAKSAIKDSMQKNKLKSIKTDTVQITLKSSTKKVEIQDESLIPEEYIKRDPVVNTMLLKAVLATGKEVPGAKLVPGAEALTIKYAGVSP